jgi:hypothetical protein
MSHNQSYVNLNVSLVKWTIPAPLQLWGKYGVSGGKNAVFESACDDQQNVIPQPRTSVQHSY